jgi:hypothetical protein
MGKYADSTILATDADITRYIEDAEGVVIAATRIDWITYIANVNAYVKKCLSTCVAAHAAKEIIAYNMYSFNSMAEATTMLNVTEKTHNDNLKILKELMTNKLRSPQT